MSVTTILRTEKLTKQFGDFTALSDVSVSFEQGRITAIIGPNGAGKSTFFNVISGAFPPSSGQIWFDGADITGLPQYRFAHLGIAKSFQITNVFPQLTAHENVRVAAQALRGQLDLWNNRDRYSDLIAQADELLALVGLYGQRNRRADVLAHGEQRALEVAMALASRPKLLLLDEPTAGMSPEETKSMMDLIVHLAAERTIILVEHKMKLVMGICSRLIVLHYGRLLAEGTPDEIRNHSEVKRVYLGRGADTVARPG